VDLCSGKLSLSDRADSQQQVGNHQDQIEKCQER